MNSDQRLETRLRAVWPAPVVLRSGHLPRPRRHGTTYLVFPSLARPVLVLPAADRAAAQALVRSDDGQRARVLSRVLAAAHHRGLLRHLPVPRVWVSDASASPLHQIVRGAVPEAATIVVRLGRPRHGRAVLLQAIAEDGRPLAFAKCATGPRVVEMREECARLREVGPAPARDVRAPRVLEFVEERGVAVLVLEALVPAREPGDPAGVVAAMRRLAAREGTVARPLADVPVLERLGGAVAELADTEARGWLEEERVRLLDEHGDVEVETGQWHGDWVGWNMARDGATVMLWDWEHHESGVPLGLDHIHHLAQHLRVRAGTSPRAEDQWLAEARSALSREWGITGAAAEATLRTYLLVINLRYVADRDGVPGPARREGWSRELLTRLRGGMSGESPGD